MAGQEKEALCMTNTILEIVEFRARDGDALIAAAADMGPWLAEQPGFRFRRLAALGDGLFLDCIEWADMTAAQQAAEQVMSAPQAAGFLQLIDPESIAMRHGAIRLTL
jgi:hypothetical protein